MSMFDGETLAERIAKGQAKQYLVKCTAHSIVCDTSKCNRCPAQDFYFVQISNVM